MRATLAEARWVVELSARVQAALTATGSLQKIGPLPVEDVVASIRGNHTYLLAAGEKLLGCAFVDPPADPVLLVSQWKLHSCPGPLWYLHSLMLEPAEQGKGLGLFFLEGIKRLVAPASGTIVLDCWAGNSKLRAFYQQAGFTFHGVFPAGDFEVAVFFSLPGPDILRHGTR